MTTTHTDFPTHPSYTQDPDMLERRLNATVGRRRSPAERQVEVEEYQHCHPNTLRPTLPDKWEPGTPIYAGPGVVVRRMFDVHDDLTHWLRRIDATVRHPDPGLLRELWCPTCLVSWSAHHSALCWNCGESPISHDDA